MVENGAKWGIIAHFSLIFEVKWGNQNKCSISSQPLEAPDKQLNNMFLGEYTHTIDDKGRLTIPAKYRGALAAGLVVTRGFDQNLMLFPLDGWQELAERIAQRPLSDEDVRAFRRRVFSGAIDLTPDRQGRILLPPYLRDFAAINGEVVIAGMFNYLEIWSTDAWQSVRASIENNADAARWEDLGI
ncbi:MAG: division/cell wall cluster transcriptional repressor MraZ [Anaerolineales bacterium]|nr:division/cell wall cluster transcriptional repressor MraZ [Anaerolineales bacterium]